MTPTENGKISVLGIVCLLITAVIIVAGLWPFNFNPVNKVEWFQNRNGIRFYGQGMVVSRQPLNFGTNHLGTDSISIEIWVLPHEESTNTVASIVTLYDHEREVFMAGQWKSELIVRVPAINAVQQKSYLEIGIAKTLTKDVVHFITMVLENKSTSIYIDGALMRSFPNFSLIPDDRGLSGQLILGNSPTGKNIWNGTFLGLSIYDQPLDNKEVQKNYQSWHKFGMPIVSTWKKPAAFYLFDEHVGKQIRDHSGFGNNLLIPVTFQPLRRTILGFPWKDQWFSHWNSIDVSFNVLGFLPFGFFLSAWLQQTEKLTTARAFLISILLGACISLAIEMIQTYLPTRDSSLLDVYSNILGTAAGALLFKEALKILHKIKVDRALLL